MQGRIVLGLGSDLTGITWKGPMPRVDYEVRLEARREEGGDFFCGLTFPVNASYCSLILGGWGGTVVGLSSIDGLDASENETSRLMNFELNKWYGVRSKLRSKKLKLGSMAPRSSIRNWLAARSPSGPKWNSRARLGWLHGALAQDCRKIAVRRINSIP